ncbi:MAG: LTA synthase family protein [Eubacteriales bacterium]|nr:LTA synthase family protein [Eubacteriales bacterium]
MDLGFKLKNADRPHFFEVAIWLVFTLGMMIKCIYFQFNTGISYLNLFNDKNITMLIGTAASIIIISALILLISNKRRFTVMMIFDSILSLLLLADSLYFRYYRNVLSVPCLYQLKLVGSTGDSISSLFRLSDLIYFLDIPLIIPGLILIYKLYPKKIIKKLHRNMKLAISALLLLIGSLVLVLSFNIAGSGMFKYDNNYIINRMGVFYFHCYDIQQFAKNNLLTDKSLSAEESAMILEHLEKRRNADTNDISPLAGTQKDKNLIVVQLEAIQNFLMFSKINGMEVTPNLNRIARESLYFSNAYYQIAGGNTSDAEFLSNCSLYPVEKGSVYFIHPTNKYHSLPWLLKDEGYETFVAHANNSSFWNRNIMYGNVGFDDYFSDVNFEIDSILGWGLEDKSFFTQCVEKLEDKEKFYAFLISLSSHHPYSMFKDFEFDTGKYEGTILGNYLKAANYVDSAIGLLFDQLEEKNMLENTMVVLYGDHFGMSREDFKYSSEFLGVDNNEYNWIKNDGIPLIIYGKGIKPARIEKACGQIDILPTIASLMGLETPYAMGKNLLSDSPGYVILRNGTVITNDFIWMNSTENLYDFDSGRKMDVAPYLNRINELHKDLQISDLILFKNAFSKIDAD